MSEASATLARALAMLSDARRSGRRALLTDRTLQVLVHDLIAARTAAGMTQRDEALRMSTTKSVVSRLESGRYARPTLNTIERYAFAVGARVEIRVRSCWQALQCAIADLRRSRRDGREWPRYP